MLTKQDLQNLLMLLNSDRLSLRGTEAVIVGALIVKLSALQQEQISEPAALTPPIPANVPQPGASIQRPNGAGSEFHNE